MSSWLSGRLDRASFSGIRNGTSPQPHLGSLFGARLTKQWALVCRKEQKGLFMVLHLCREAGLEVEAGPPRAEPTQQARASLSLNWHKPEPWGSWLHITLEAPASNRAGVSWIMGRL